MQSKIWNTTSIKSSRLSLNGPSHDGRRWFRRYHEALGVASWRGESGHVRRRPWNVRHEARIIPEHARHVGALEVKLRSEVQRWFGFGYLAVGLNLRWRGTASKAVSLLESFLPW